MNLYKNQLQESLKYGKIKKINSLLPLVNVNALDDCGMAYIHHAYEDFGESVFKTLLQSAHVDINIQDDKGNTALMLAVRKNISAVRMLLDAGAALELKNTSQETALIKAVHDESFSLEVIQLLIRKGACCDEIDKSGYSALGNALFLRFHPAFDLLLEHTDVTLNKKDINIMLMNILSNDVDGIKEHKVIEKICIKAYTSGRLDILESQLNRQMKNTQGNPKHLYFKDIINKIKLNNKLNIFLEESEIKIKKSLKL